MAWEWPIRILLALALTGALGFEREARHKAAGLRTHMLVGMGATLFTLVSLDVPDADPARVAAGVVTGVGFLGAGVIFRQGTTVRGLTTAASLWVAAAIGLAVGTGRLIEATAATAVALLVLAVLRRLDRRIPAEPKEEEEEVRE
jgi:putative Mg2+ transporter-C (MgtC) family protein